MTTAKSDRPTFAADAIPSDVKSGVFLGSPVVDNVVGCIIAMSTEIWATKRRMKVMEAVMTKAGITTEMIETYVPTPEQAKEWEKDRDRFIDLALGPLADQGFRGASADFPKRG